MVQVKDNEAKVSRSYRSIKVKDAIVYDGKLTDVDGNNVLAEIENALPDGVETISFTIKVELPEELD